MKNEKSTSRDISIQNPQTKKSSNEFNICPICKSKKIAYVQNKKWFCSDCGFDLYNNVAAAVGLIIQDVDDSIILEVRAKEPRKGFLALPGGFCDQDESAEEAAFRECKEETGIAPTSVKYIASFPNTYLYKNITYKTCDLFFLATFKNYDSQSKSDLANSTNSAKNFSNGAIESSQKIIDKMKRQVSEVESFKSVKISSLSDIENLPLAFESGKKALSVWFKNFYK